MKLSRILAALMLTALLLPAIGSLAYLLALFVVLAAGYA